MSHPFLEARNLLTQTPAGPRVNYNLLLMSLRKTPAELKAWFSLSVQIKHDQYGLEPEVIEQLLSEFPLPEKTARQMSFFQDDA